MLASPLSKVRARTGVLVAAGVLLIGGASACSSSSPTVETAKSSTPGSAATNVPRTDVGTVPGTDVVTEGTLAPADAGTTVPGETTTTAAGAPPVTGANGAPVTTSPTATTTPGSPTTAGGVTTTAKPGGVTTQAPVTTKPVTTVATTTPTTAAPQKPTLSARPAPDPSHPTNPNQIMCMGSAPSASVTIEFTASGADRVAAAIGQLSDAFAAANPRIASGSASSVTVSGLSCTAPAGGVQYTTVTAEGPGGKSQPVVITWTIMKM